VSKLAAMGHKLQTLDDTYGNMQAVYWDRKNGRMQATSDLRGIGSAAIR